MAFPVIVRREAGFQLDKIQRGYEPDDWKPMSSVGAGVREIRVRVAPGAFRVIYVVVSGEAVYVLHAFQKKSQKTAQHDVRLARDRFKAVVR